MPPPAVISITPKNCVEVTRLYYILTVTFYELWNVQFIVTLFKYYFHISDGCENKKCEYYAKCESDSSGEAKCICPNKCDEPVSFIVELNISE